MSMKATARMEGKWGRRVVATYGAGRKQSAGRDAVTREDAKRTAIVLRKMGSSFRTMTSLR